MSVSIPKNCKNIVSEIWLARILKQEVYNVILDDWFIRHDGRDIVEKAQMQNVFLYSKVPVHAVGHIEFLEECGFHLVDTNVILKKEISSDFNHKGIAKIRSARRGDQDSVAKLSQDGFVFSRFHMDKKFSIETANAIKAEWVRSYFRGQRGKYMAVAEIDGMVVGFIQLLIDQKGVLTIDLIAVNNNFRRKGIASDMILYTQQHCKNVSQIRVGTQLANNASICMYEKLGFYMSESFYVFHYHSSRENVR